MLLRRECAELKNRQLLSNAWYHCENCNGCPCRSQYCRAKDPTEPKEIVLKKTFWEKRATAIENITTPRGIHLRLCFSVQAEGAYTLLKSDFGFRRSLSYHGKANVQTERILCKTFVLQHIHFIFVNRPIYQRKTTQILCLALTKTPLSKIYSRNTENCAEICAVFRVSFIEDNFSSTELCLFVP